MEFYLPEWPPAFGNKDLYPDVVKWIVRLEGKNKNEICEIDGKFGCINPCLTLNLQKNEILSVTATPVTEFGENLVEFFKCAGSIYPINNEVTTTYSVKNQLLWENGFAAYIMQRFVLSGRENGYSEEQIEEFLKEFNWKKFQQVLNKKTEDSFVLFSELESEEVTTTSNVIFYNPWLCDLEKVLDQIAFGNFTATAVNMKSVFSAQSTEFKDFMSSYVPENEIISNYGCLCLKSKERNLFSVYNSYGVLFEGTSAKKLSIEPVFLPIYIEEYEKK